MAFQLEIGMSELADGSTPWSMPGHHEHPSVPQVTLERIGQVGLGYGTADQVQPSALGNLESPGP